MARLKSVKPKPLLYSLLLLGLFCLPLADVCAQVLKGTIYGTDNQPLAFASVYVDQTTKGVTTDIKGRYFFEIPSGKQLITFSFMGYESQTIEVSLTAGVTLTKNITLVSNLNEIQTVEVVGDVRDRGTEIMREAIKRRSEYYDAVQSYSCRTYVKSSLEKVKSNELTDTLPVSQEVLDAANLADYFGRENLNLIESISTTNFEKPGKIKEVVVAYHNYTQGNVDIHINRQSHISFEADVGRDFGNIAPSTPEEKNPYLIYEDLNSSTLDFYENTIDFPALTQQPLLSPMAATATLSYKFYFDGVAFEGERKVNKIRVEPRFPTEALFEGTIFIAEDDYALLGVDLEVNAKALLFCKKFKIIQNYAEQADNQYVPVRRELTYTIRDGSDIILGNSRIDHSEYTVNKKFDRKFFGAEIKRYEANAFEQDSTFWAQNRTIILSNDELDYIHRSDSITDYFVSNEYFRKLDSAFNRVDWWTPLAGYGRRNRVKGNELYIQGILGQINPVGIGGYRHRIPGTFTKTFKNGKSLSNDGFVDYGFRNRDIKGRLTTGFTWIPEKFVKTSVNFGDYYDLINNFASIEQTFSRSNYVRNRVFGIAQRMEIKNGLFAELGFEFADQKAIDNLELSRWSDRLFGDLNEPIPFERYLKSEVTLKLKYRFHQRYVMRGNQKIIIGSNYPEINFTYRKGLPGVLGCEVNYDYADVEIYDDIQLARFGYSQWSASMGTYFNKANLRVLEHKYFRGSDRWFFSNPVFSLQLLGPTLHTPNEWFQANYIHHFEGAILNKVPLLNRLKLQLAGGAGTLVIPDNDFAHAEVFAGLERVFRIKEELFRFSVWAVTSDSSLDKAQFTFKFGIGFYNTFTKKWEY